MPKGWKYSGDMDLECGGFYWKDEGDSDFVIAVDIIPCSDAGGPDNLFYVEKGTIYFHPDKYAEYLSTIGMEVEEATRDDLINAAKAYGGIERDSETVIRIGKDQSEDVRAGGWNPEPDTILRSDASLRKYVEREFLN
jgi:hypothetical protein